MQSLPSFWASSTRQNGKVTVALRGELDIAGCPALKEVLDPISNRRASVVLDMAELSFLDCCGLRPILEASNRLDNAGGALRLIRVPAMILRTLRVLGLDDMMTQPGVIAGALRKPEAPVLMTGSHEASQPELTHA